MFSGDPKRRLTIIYVGIIVMTILILIQHLVSKNIEEEWLPSRTGEGRVVEKKIQNKESPEAVYLLMVRVAVPPADGDDANAHILKGIVVASKEDWESVAPGSIIGVQYRTDPAYERLAIEAVYANVVPE